MQSVRGRLFQLWEKVIKIENGESYISIWSGMKKRLSAGVGFLIKKCKEITIEDPDKADERILGLNIKLKGFKLRYVNAYSPTNWDGSDFKKDLFYQKLKKSL